MDRHFIESYEDERDVLRKVEELKTLGYAESDMYVIARTNEQLTMIRTRTDVDYHAAEGKGMGRLGIFIRGGPIPHFFTEIANETKESAFYYQQLLDGKLLLYCNKNTVDSSIQWPESSIIKEDTELKNFSSLQHGMQSNEEDRIFIDSIHYENFEALKAEPIRKLPEKKRKN